MVAARGWDLVPSTYRARSGLTKRPHRVRQRTQPSPPTTGAGHLTVRIAAIDLGSNSFHLIVAEVRFDGTFSPLAREKVMLRLGDVVAKTGSIGPVAMADAIEVLTRFQAIVSARHCDEVIAFGTAAIREASDGQQFVELARRETGFEIQVVDG